MMQVRGPGLEMRGCLRRAANGQIHCFDWGMYSWFEFLEHCFWLSADVRLSRTVPKSNVTARNR